MQPSPLPVGTVVRLNSGGPKMTVCDHTDAGLHCQWFDPDNCSRVREGVFPASSVVTVAVVELPSTDWLRGRGGVVRSYVV